MIYAKPRSISMRKIQTSDEDESVNKMLNHMRQLPGQDLYSPQSVPMVFIRKQDEEKNVVCDTSSSVEYVYLSSKKDLATWNLLNNSLTNHNVFVGNLSYIVDQLVLKTVFETLVAKEQQHLLKVRLVTEPHSGASKGYGFVEFPYRRAAELALICLQGFELHGREMQLGWGQNVNETSQDCFKDQIKNHGAIISDSRPAHSRKHAKDTQRRRRTRWDVEQHGGNSEPISQPVSYANGSSSGDSGDFSIHRISPSSEGKEQSRKLFSGRQHGTSGHFVESNVIFSTVDKRTAIDWIAKERRVNLIKAVCGNLRKKNVTGHLGVFGEHFETDNTGFNVWFSKQLPEQELGSTFEQFGTLSVNTMKSVGCHTHEVVKSGLK